MRVHFALILIVLFTASAYAIPAQPILIESSPAPNSEYTTAPQQIPFRIMINTEAVTGGSANYSMSLLSASDPTRAFSFNEADFTTTGGMYPYGTWGFEGSLVSKHLPPGNYLLHASYRWQVGANPPGEWTHDIPIRLTGSAPPAIPESFFQMQTISPTEDSPPRRYAVGTENSFPVEIQLTNRTPGKSIVSFANSISLVQVENPAAVIVPANWTFQNNWADAMGVTRGPFQSHAGLPVGHYNLVVSYTWRESVPAYNPFEIFEYHDEKLISFEVFDPANDHFVVERSLPHNPIIPETLFVSRLLVDSRSDSPTGVVITEPIPNELEYVPLEDELAPESTSPLVWLLRNPERVPFTEIRYGLRVKEGVAAGTVIHLTGQSEILGDSKPIGGDNTLTVAGLSLACPIPNQILLGHIDTWGRFVRDELRPTDAIVDDLTLLQIIDRWRNCIRGGAPV